MKNHSWQAKPGPPAKLYTQTLMASIFTTEQWLPYPVPLVFAFFANPENLPRLMPAWQKARIEEAMFAAPPPRPEGSRLYPGIAAGTGSRLVISAKPFPLAPFRLPWEALIEDFRWNEGFCDVQGKGPFKSWRHCHSVRAELKDGLRGTVVRDEVHYELSVGMTPLARPGLAYVFSYRQKRTAELLSRASRKSG
jgi:ligand-binding SRPBCC domain-containing protein